jgi:hypothetical protein
MTGYRVADYVLSDEATLTQLIGSLAVDVVKIAIVTQASIGAAALGAATGFVLGPIAAVVAIGIIGTATLDVLDKRLHITDHFIAWLDEITGGKGNLDKKVKDAISNYGELLLTAPIPLG